MHPIKRTIVNLVQLKINNWFQIAQIREVEVTVCLSALSTQYTQMLVAVAAGRVEILKRNEADDRAEEERSC